MQLKKVAAYKTLYFCQITFVFLSWISCCFVVSLYTHSCFLSWIPCCFVILLFARSCFLSYISRYFISCCMPALVSYLGSLVILSFCYLLALAASAAFFCLVMLLFLIIEFQLFCYCFLCSVYFFFLDFYLLEYSNNLCWISLDPICQLALQSLFVYFWLSAHIIWMIIMTCII